MKQRYGIFGQNEQGLNWLCNEDTVESAERAAFDFQHPLDESGGSLYDFILILPVAWFIEVPDNTAG